MCLLSCSIVENKILNFLIGSKSEIFRLLQG